MVDLLISSDVGRYLEYKALERIYTVLEDQTFEKVPLSKEDVFLSQTVGVADKRRLMKFLTFCLDHENQPQEYQGFFLFPLPLLLSHLLSSLLSLSLYFSLEDHADLPFSQFLSHKQITGHLQHVIQFAIALDQRGDVTTRTGLKLVKEHLTSLGRYGNTAFLWPMYGISETAQAFCRLTAIFGGVYMLRCKPKKFLLQPGTTTESSKISHVVVGEDQAIDCQFVVSNLDYLPTKDREGLRYSRAILVVEGKVHPDTVIDFTVIPPDRFGNSHPVYLIHTDGNAGSSPDGKGWLSLFLKKKKRPLDVKPKQSPDVFYLSTLSHHQTAKEDLQAVVDAYFAPRTEGEEAGTKPNLLYSLYYSQRVRESDWQGPENLLTVPDADQNLTHEDCVAVARRMFESMFPGEDFLPPTPRPEEALSVEAILAEESTGATGFTEGETSS